MKKNFKRLLCLVLVVSLVCSLAVTGFAAGLSSYTDVDDITYTEAVDVLTGVGILEGSDGTFKPNDNMTRAEAAKIIAYLKLGAETASALTATSAPFDDVPLSHWASGYIAYCASAGIVNGDGTGNFNPEANVTAYEFGKMLLCTVGYGQNGEYTGASWAITVAAAAGALGIYADKEGTLSGNTAITRDEMALYTFNTLTDVAQVNYNATLAEYYVGTGALNSLSTSIRDSYKYESYINDDDTDETGYEYTIGYLTYDLVKAGSNDVTTQTVDAFGRPCYNWESDGVEVSDTYVDGDPDYSFSNNVESQAIYNKVGRTIAAYNFYLYEDSDSATSTTDDSGNTVYTSTIAVKNSDSKVVQRGSTLELYVDDVSDTVQAVLINTYLAKVTDVDASGSDIELTLEAYNVDGEDEKELTIDDSIASNLANFEEDDYVLITWSDAEPDLAQSIKAATVVEGVATAYVSGSSITVDGTKYSYSYTFSKNSNGYGYETLQNAYGDYDTTYVIYADEYGNIIGFEEADDSNSSTAAANKKYLYVESVSADVCDGFDDAEVKIKATFTDGTTETVYLKLSDEDSETDARVTINSDKTYPLTSSDELTAVKTALKGNVYAYTVNSSGYYTLTDLSKYSYATQYSTVTVDDKSAVAFGNTTLYASSSTKLVLVDDQKIYTGYANFPSETWTVGSTTGVDAILALKSSSSSRLTYVYVFGDGATSTEDLIYAMYTGSGDVTVSDGSETAQFWVNGSKETYEFDEGDVTNASWYGYTFVGGWIEVGSDGLAEFTPFSKQGVQFENDDYYMYYGTVSSKDGDTIYVSTSAGDYTFSLAEDYQSTRLKSNGSGSSSAPSAGDYVWVFTENAVGTSGSSEAIATIAVASDNSKVAKLVASVDAILGTSSSSSSGDSSDDTTDDTTDTTGDTTETTETTETTTETTTE